MSIKFAPLHLPLERRLQTLAALVHVFVVSMSGYIGYAIIAYMTCFTRFYWLAFAYVCYIVGDWGIECRGSHPSNWVRHWTWWRYFRNYFPIKLIKTAELDTSKNYLLCVYPHGVISIGVFINFGTEANNVSQVFPGIATHTITLGIKFKMPFVREMLLRMGFGSSSKESLDYLLDRGRGTGRSVVLVVGGAAEALRAKPGTFNISLKNRKGFIKIALKNGASIVPVISFGENDIYDQVDNPEGSWLRWGQEAFRKITGVTPVLANGRGIFQYSFGLIPRRKPITTVVGEPMEAVHIPEPTQEQIDDLHMRFQKKLTVLFEEHKHNYLENAENIFLVID